jgi:hypothetical protein
VAAANRQESSLSPVLAEQPDEWTEQHRYVDPDILTNRTGTSPDTTDTTEADGPPSALGRGHMSDPEPEPPHSLSGTPRPWT